jgi:hypothetical protein
VVTARLRVVLGGRIIRHPACLRAEHQLVTHIAFDGWCTFCIAPAGQLAAISSLWPVLPAPWRRAVPVCDRHAELSSVVTDLPAIASATGAEATFDQTTESRVARSLRRCVRAAR